MSGRDDRPPAVPDCYGCIWFIATRGWDSERGQQTVVHDCGRARVEVPDRCNEYACETDCL